MIVEVVLDAGHNLLLWVHAGVGRRACRKERNNSKRPETTHKYDFCGRDCFSHIGLCSYKRRCNNRTDREPGCTPMIDGGHTTRVQYLTLGRAADLGDCLTVGGVSDPRVCLLAALTSQQHASVSQGRIYSDDCACCHTEIEIADKTFYLTQSQYTDTGPTSNSAWQGSHWCANF